VSLDRSDVLTLRRRAAKLYGGNLSAAVAEGARRIREEEGREALVDWLGKAAEATPEERESILAEWRGEAPKRRRPRAASRWLLARIHEVERGEILQLISFERQMIEARKVTRPECRPYRPRQPIGDRVGIR
jgi:hypothetical protein